MLSLKKNQGSGPNTPRPQQNRSSSHHCHRLWHFINDAADSVLNKTSDRNANWSLEKRLSSSSSSQKQSLFQRTRSSEQGVGSSRLWLMNCLHTSTGGRHRLRKQRTCCVNRNAAVSLGLLCSASVEDPSHVVGKNSSFLLGSTLKQPTFNILNWTILKL